MSKIIDIVKISQANYIKGKKREDLKNKSQFFTPYEIALQMISTIDLEKISKLKSISILEPSAGCGILVAALVDKIINNSNNLQKIFIDVYEKDKELAKILKQNLECIKKIVYEKNKVTINYKVICNNFILYNSDKWNKNNPGKYDYIISNPPYKKINKTSEEAVVMNKIIYGQPNIYTLFIVMCIKLLKKDGILVVLSPRSYLTGEYSKKIREYIFENSSLLHIHSFDKRNIFSTVNQEVIICTYSKCQNIKNVKLSFNGNLEFETRFEQILNDKESMSIVVPKSVEDIKILNKFKQFKYFLDELGYKVSVGPVVQFRNEEYLSKDIYSAKFAPLLICNDIQNNNLIIYDIRENRKKTHNKSISIKNKYLIKNSNYLLLRKVSARDDNNVITCAVINKNFFNHTYVGLDNNLLYFLSNNNSELSIEECYGLYCFVNCNQFAHFYSLINGTHTINVTDFSKIKFPSKKIIILIGKEIIKSQIFDKQYCSKIIEKYVF